MTVIILAVPLWIYLVYHAYRSAERGGSQSDTGGGTDEVEPLDRAPPAAENTYGVIEHALVWYRENRPKRAITDGYLERFRERWRPRRVHRGGLRYMRDAMRDWGRTMGRVDVGPAVGELEDEFGEVYCRTELLIISPAPRGASRIIRTSVR